MLETSTSVGATSSPTAAPIARRQIDAELIELCAIDSKLYSRMFFAKTVRQEFPSFEDEVWSVLEGPERLKCLQLFRGAAKTTRLRLFASKRIAYGISRTIVWLGKSEGHARKSGRWLKNQVEHNRIWAQTFHLRRGMPWNDTEFEIIQDVPGAAEPVRIYILCLGITGSVRGINVDDHRPDLIIADDVLDEENSATPEQREKCEDLLYGAAKNSLVPTSEEPMACMVALQTPLQREDFSVKAETDPEWSFLRVGCWTKETELLPLDQQVSSWPARFPTHELRLAKVAEIRRNKLSRWMREQECRVISPELCSFRVEWLRPWEKLPAIMSHVLIIDPVPPPSEVKRQAGKVTTDYEALAVMGSYGGNFYLREVSVNRGHEPNWTISEVFRLWARYKVQRIIVETVAYQRVLAWLLREAMRHRGIYIPIEEFEGQSSKFNRIVDGLSGPASNGALLLPPASDPQGLDNSEGMRMFFQQFAEYPRVANDDALEVVAVGCAALSGRILLGDEHALEIEKALEEEDRRIRGGAAEVDLGLSYSP